MRCWLRYNTGLLAHYCRVNWCWNLGNERVLSEIWSPRKINLSCGKVLEICFPKRFKPCINSHQWFFKCVMPMTLVLRFQKECVVWSMVIFLHYIFWLMLQWISIYSKFSVSSKKGKWMDKILFVLTSYSN